MNTYELSRGYFEWCFENPEKISPNHTAIYFFAIEHCNRMGWKTKFAMPTQMAMDALGIKNHQTYIRYFNDLVNWGFLKMIQKSTNQYSANIISINIAMPKNNKALGKAIYKHATKQDASNPQSKLPIDKHNNIETLKQETINNIPVFDEVLVYAKEKEPSIDPKALKNKYDAWVENDWKDGNDSPIKNWKTKICHTLPYINKITTTITGGKSIYESVRSGTS